VLGWPALGVAIELRVERVEPMKQLVFRSDDASLELNFREGQIELRHSAQFEDDDEREGTLSSWRMALATLAHYLEQHDGRARTVHWAVERSQASIADAHAFFTLSGAQRGWLTRTSTGSGIGDVNSEVALDLAWGPSLTGRVLAHTPPRDALISWRETNHSLLALRTLPCPGSSSERLLVATWSTWDMPETAHISAQLAAALQRLAQLHKHRASA